MDVRIININFIPYKAINSKKEKNTHSKTCKVYRGFCPYVSHCDKKMFTMENRAHIFSSLSFSFFDDNNKA